MAASRRKHRRGRRQGRSWDRASILRALAAAGFALAAAMLVFRIASPAILIARDQPGLASFSAGDPNVTYRLAEAEYSARGGEVSAATQGAVRRAAASTPLAATPFAFASLGEDRAAAVRLLEEARRRDPRLRAARMMLIDHYVRSGRIDAAATEIKVVSRLQNRLGELLVLPLARLAADPRTRPALQRAIGDDPVLDGVLAALVREGADSATIIALGEARRRHYSPGRPPVWQRALVDARVASGDYAEARSLWTRFSGSRQAGPGLNNPNFARDAGWAPFDWQFIADSSGASDPVPGGGIEVVYFGRADAELARQLVLLAPGRYRLRSTAAALVQGQGQGSHLAWRLSCATGNARLAELSLDRLAAAPRTLQADFSVPASCPAIWVKLIGESAEFPARREIRVSEVRIARAGAPQ